MYLFEAEEELKSESWEEEEVEESNYRKKVDALRLRSAFEILKELNESRDPSSVPSCPKQKPNIVVVVGKQLQPLISCCSSTTQSFFASSR